MKATRQVNCLVASAYEILVLTSFMRRTHATLNDEDPPPSAISRNAFHLHQTKGQDTTESRSHGADQIEDRISLANLI